MKTRIWIGIIAVLVLGLVAGGYFLYDFSSRNKELTANIEQLNQELSEKTDQLDASEESVDSLTEEVDQLTVEIDDLQSEQVLQNEEYDQLQSNYDELFDFTYCGDELIDLENMVYRSNAKALGVLTEWTENMWGDVIDSYWWDFWHADAPALHVIETGYTENFFIVYFEQQDFMNAPNGVFIVSHHCWLDVELDN